MCNLKRHLRKEHKIDVAIDSIEPAMKRNNKQKQAKNPVAVQPHKCDICEKSFTQKASLNRHIKSVHENSKPHKCDICELSFSEKGTLKRHIQSVHLNSKPHKCDICEQSFTQKGHLKKHIQSVHGK